MRSFTDEQAQAMFDALVVAYGATAGVNSVTDMDEVATARRIIFAAIRKAGEDEATEPDPWALLRDVYDCGMSNNLHEVIGDALAQNAKVAS